MGGWGRRRRAVRLIPRPSRWTLVAMSMSRTRATTPFASSRRWGPTGCRAPSPGWPGANGSADGTNSDARVLLSLWRRGGQWRQCLCGGLGNDTIRKLTPPGTNWVSSTIAGLARVISWQRRSVQQHRWHEQWWRRFNRPQACRGGQWRQCLCGGLGQLHHSQAHAGRDQLGVEHHRRAGWEPQAAPMAPTATRGFRHPHGVAVDSCAAMSMWRTTGN